MPHDRLRWRISLGSVLSLVALLAVVFSVAVPLLRPEPHWCHYSPSSPFSNDQTKCAACHNVKPSTLSLTAPKAQIAIASRCPEEPWTKVGIHGTGQTQSCKACHQ
jgi:hypothetical protein